VKCNASKTSTTLLGTIFLGIVWAFNIKKFMD